MSRDILSYGFIAVLENPMDNNLIEDFSENLYELNSNLKINNDGTLIYIDFNKKKESEEIYQMNP